VKRKKGQEKEKRKEGKTSWEGNEAGVREKMRKTFRKGESSK